MMPRTRLAPSTTRSELALSLTRSMVPAPTCQPHNNSTPGLTLMAANGLKIKETNQTVVPGLPGSGRTTPELALSHA